MKKQADYIKRIEINGLWGRKNISWELQPEVNILSGVNGGGKSTILNKSVNTLDMLEYYTLSLAASQNPRPQRLGQRASMPAPTLGYKPL